MDYYQHLATHGGMATCGGHLGVYVKTAIAACPNGWIYIPLDLATPEVVKEAIELAKLGRSAWPKND